MDRKNQPPPDPQSSPPEPSLDEKLDRALEDTFPASDPVAISEPAPKKNDEKRR